MTRRATSPRFATRIFPITCRPSRGLRRSLGPDAEERLVILDTLRVLGQDLDYLTRDVRWYLVHQLHGLDDAQWLPCPYVVADFGVGFSPRRRSPVESSYHRRTHHVQAPVAFRRTLDGKFRLGDRRDLYTRRDLRPGLRRSRGPGHSFGPGLHGNLQLPLPDPDLADPALGQKLDEPADVFKRQRLPLGSRLTVAHRMLSLDTGPDCNLERPSWGALGGRGKSQFS